MSNVRFYKNCNSARYLFWRINSAAFRLWKNAPIENTLYMMSFQLPRKHLWKWNYATSPVTLASNKAIHQMQLSTMTSQCNKFCNSVEIGRRIWSEWTNEYEIRIKLYLQSLWHRTKRFSRCCCQLRRLNGIDLVIPCYVTNYCQLPDFWNIQ